MKRLAFDIETDGLLREEPGRARIMSTVHCICITDLATDATLRFHNDPGLVSDGSLDDALDELDTADQIGGHNVIDFDLPALDRMFGWVPGERQVVRDTLVMARLMFPWIKDYDFRDRKMPPKLRGAHNLKAWGWRLGKQKGEFADIADDNPDLWNTLTQEMLDYCARDTEVTALLWRTLEGRRHPKRSVDLEHRFAKRISGLMHAGVGYDKEAGQRFERDWVVRQGEVRDRLRERFGTWVKRWKTPVRQEPREKVMEVNPGSGAQVAEALQRLYGWKPTAFTPTGMPKMDEEAIRGMDEKVVPPEVKADLLEDAGYTTALKYVSRGRSPWNSIAQLVEEPAPHHRVFYYVNHNGAWTGRCTHRVVVNVPRVTSPFGQELRSLFVPTPGGYLAGADMKSGEAVVIAHLLFPYDHGAFAERLRNGEDVHTATLARCEAAVPGAVKTRQDAKGGVYAVAYGAQDKKVGAMYGVGPRKGKLLRDAILAGIPGLGRLFDDHQTLAAEKGYVISLDGRPVRPRAAYAALNSNVQSHLGVVMKLATDLACAELEPLGCRLVLHFHDEYQFDCPGEVDREHVTKTLVWAIEEASRRTGLRCLLTGEAKTGASWAETH